MLPSLRYRGRLWQVCLPVGFLLGLISSAAAQGDRASHASPASAIEVEVANALLTLHADGVTLAEVLHAVGEAGSFRVVLRGAFATPVSESFADQPLEDAIRRLVEGHSIVILHERLNASGAAALAEVRVIENRAQASSGHEIVDAPARDGAEAAQNDAVNDPPIDREAFRLANLKVSPPTREDILIELGDFDPTTRVAAVPKLGALGTRTATAVLARVFAGEDDALVRSRGVAALIRLDGPGAQRLLRERARGDNDTEVRMQALIALASSAGERSINALGQALRRDPEPEVRMAAIRSLRRVGGQTAQRYLERAVTDFDPQISLAAEQALDTWPTREE